MFPVQERRRDGFVGCVLAPHQLKHHVDVRVCRNDGRIVGEMDVGYCTVTRAIQVAHSRMGDPDVTPGSASDFGPVPRK